MKIRLLLFLTAACLLGQSSRSMLVSLQNNAASISFTLVQHPRATGCSGTTCAVTLTQSVGAGHLLIFDANFVSAEPSTFASVDKGGTITVPVGCRGSDATNGGRPKAYIISSSTATTPITVTWTATTNANVEIWEYSYTGGTPDIDFCNAMTYPSGTTPVGPSFTLSSGNHVITQSCATANNCTAASSPYSTNADFASGNGWAAVINSTSGTGPTWTLSGAGVTSLGGMGFSLSPSAFSNQTFADFEGSTTGTSATVALLNASTKGWTGGPWTVHGTALKFQSAASQPLLNATGRLNDGGNYAASAGSLGMQYTTTSGALNWLQMELPKLGRHASAGIWLFTDMPSNDVGAGIDMFSIVGGNGSDFITAQLCHTGTVIQVGFETPVQGSCNGGITISPSTWYWVTLEYDNTATHHARVYLSDGTTQSGSTFNGTVTGTNATSWIFLGNAASSAPTTGKVINFDSMKVSLDGTYPLLP